jgi:radical SAM superfamily enzyme YgiQ (UPF0313 family)
VKDYYGKYWRRSPLCTFEDILRLFNKGVYNIKMLDEVFLKDTNEVHDLLEMLRFIGDRLNIWGYARVDTIREGLLAKARRAGVRWLALGIETASEETRRKMRKGSFSNGDIFNAVRMCEDNGIQVIANYIIGLDGETEDDFQATKDMAMELNTAFINVYSYVDYTHNAEQSPISGAFRDQFFWDYFTNPDYQKKIIRLFGDHGIRTIGRMLDARVEERV